MSADHVVFGAFVPQGWKMELASVEGAEAKWTKAVEIAVRAEELGYDSIWVYDHFHNVPRPANEAVFECWTTLAAISQLTSTIRLGQMVGCNSYRNPGVLAKSPPPSTSSPVADPKPLQDPHPPVWIGGGGEQLTLRVVAQHADCSNFGGRPDQWAHKREVLKGHCAAIGRDEDTIRKTWSPEVLIRSTEAEIDAFGSRSLWGEPAESWREGNLIGTPEQVSEKIRVYLDLGCTGFIPWCADYPDTETLERFAAEVMLEFR